MVWASALFFSAHGSPQEIVDALLVVRTQFDALKDAWIRLYLYVFVEVFISCHIPNRAIAAIPNARKPLLGMVVIIGFATL